VEQTEPETVDRRVLRGQRNRQAVLEALAELIAEGDLSPTAEEIAERAGLSVRSIYHHFDDIEGLHRAVADEHLRTIASLIEPIPDDGPLEVRLDAFIAQRVLLFETAMPVYRASLLAAMDSPAIAERVALSHVGLRALTEQTFAIELDGAEPWRLEALDALTSLDGWVRLRVAQELDPDTASHVMARAIRAVLDA
jgi:TetR/AcrR family transcriptional regulator of autoinduction and epiphytic fitness